MPLRQAYASSVHRLVVLGLHPSLASQIGSKIQEWEEKSGLEWTISRLKEIKVWYLKHLSGELEYHPPYFQHRNSKPVGPWGTLFKLKDRKLVIGALMVYSQFVAKQPTEKQLSKFFTSMQRPPINKYKAVLPPTGFFPQEDPVSGKITTYSWLSEGRSKENLYSNAFTAPHGRIRDSWNDIVLRGPTLFDWSSSETRRAPIFRKVPGKEDYRLVTVVESDCSLKEHLTSAYFSPFLQNSLLNRLPPYLWRELHPSHQNDSKNFILDPRLAALRKKFPEDLVGKISFIQEPGFKLRAIANPFRAHQSALWPLSIRLWETLKSLPGSYVHDQDSGILRVMDALEKGSWVDSIDLSDATNNFPLEYQMFILKGLAPDMGELIGYFEGVSRGSWLAPDGKYYRWSVGQPLGLHPSFAAFTLGQLALLYSLAGIPVTFTRSASTFAEIASRLPFAVIGDDVVIFDPDLAVSYRRILSSWDVPISPTKSLASNQCAEFGGKIITSSEVISQDKWRELTTQNCVEVCKNNPLYVALLPTHQQRVVKEILSLPEPFGLGLNPKGISLSDRLNGLEELLWDHTVTPGNFSERRSYRSPTPGYLRTVDISRKSGTVKDILTPDRELKGLFPLLEILDRQGFPVGKDLEAQYKSDGSTDILKVLRKGFLPTSRTNRSQYAMWKERLKARTQR